MILSLPRLLFLLTVYCLSNETGATPTPADPDIIGEALHPDSGELLYRELHYCDESALLCTVLYRDSGGELMARKQLDYRANLQAPALELTDLRNDINFSTTQADYEADYVVDAGFDNFIRKQWGTFSNGKSVRFPLLVAGRERPLSMRASEDTARDCTAREFCVEVRLDSWLLGALVSPIELTYDREGRQLLRYKGISNIRNGSGRNPVVDIHYRYSHQAGNSPLQLASP